MTSDSSNPPASGATFQAQLAALLYGLRQRGFTVGVDDAARVAAAFRDAQDWSREKRVRILKALIARTDAERTAIDQMAPFLFRAVPKSAAAHPPSAPSRSRKTTEDESRESEEVPDAPPKRRGVVLAVVALVVLVTFTSAIFVQRYLDYLDPSESSFEPAKTDGSEQPRAPSGAGDGEAKRTERQGKVSLDAGSPAVTKREASDGGTSGDVGVSSTGTGSLASAGPSQRKASAPNRASDTGPPAPSMSSHSSSFLDWLLLVAQAIALLLLWASLGTLWWLWRRSRPPEEVQRALRVLADHEGERTFKFEVPPHVLASPMDPNDVREAAFHLSAPSVSVESERIDGDQTVRETVKRAGRLSLHFEAQLEHRSIVFIEDKGPSMVRWPDHGRQLVLAIRRQGSDVHHWFMDRTPDVLFRSDDLRRGVPLTTVLSGLEDAQIIAFSDAAGLDSYAEDRPLKWLDRLEGATWLHPRPPDRWGLGARRLTARINVVPVSPDGLLRLRNRSTDFHHGALRRWSISGVSLDNEDRLARLRGGLGFACFRWLAAGAVLARAGVLTTRSMWAMLVERLVAVPWEEAERVWDVPDVVVAADGTITLDPSIQDALVGWLRDRDPRLLSQVVQWASDITSKHRERLRRGAPASLAARATQARLLGIDPTHRADASGLTAPILQHGFMSFLRSRRSQPDKASAAQLMEVQTNPAYASVGASTAAVAGLLVFAMPFIPTIIDWTVEAVVFSTKSSPPEAVDEGVETAISERLDITPVPSPEDIAKSKRLVVEGGLKFSLPAPTDYLNLLRKLKSADGKKVDLAVFVSGIDVDARTSMAKQAFTIGVLVVDFIVYAQATRKAEAARVVESLGGIVKRIEPGDFLYPKFYGVADHIDNRNWVKALEHFDGACVMAQEEWGDHDRLSLYYYVLGLWFEFNYLLSSFLKNSYDRELSKTLWGATIAKALGETVSADRSSDFGKLLNQAVKAYAAQISVGQNDPVPEENIRKALQILQTMRNQL